MFAKRSLEIVKYIEQRSFKNAEMSKFLAWMEENQADGDYAMEHFFLENEAKWSAWLPASVAKKVKKAIDELNLLRWFKSPKFSFRAF